jgi:hypothetical protein
MREGKRSIETRRGRWDDNVKMGRWDDNVKMDLKETGYEDVVSVNFFGIMISGGILANMAKKYLVP